MIDGTVERGSAPPGVAHKPVVRARSGLTPKQDRSRANREALLDSFMELLRERPDSDISVAEIARRAAMTTGAVYGRFGDKRGLALALHERFAERAGATMEDWGQRPQWASATPRQIINSWTRGAVNFGRMYRPLVTLMVNDDVLAERYREMVARPPRILARLLRAAMQGPLPDGFDDDVEWAARATMAVLERFDLNDDELYERVENMLCRLIGVN